MSDHGCHTCNGMCCRYLALPIEKPTTKDDFEDIRWYLAHHGTSIFVEDGDWYIQVDNHCRHLTKKNLCNIYDHRPRICRDYKLEDCEMSGGDYQYDLHLKSMADLEKYLAKRKRKKTRAKKTTVKKRKK